jgi:hypothetical protein
MRLVAPEIYFKEEESLQINDFSLHLKLEQEKQVSPKVS